MGKRDSKLNVRKTIEFFVITFMVITLIHFSIFVFGLNTITSEHDPSLNILEKKISVLL
jgi:hypothetical protein